MNFKLIAAAFTTVAALTACNIQSSLDDLNQEVIDAAFDTIKQEAETQGGAAAKVERGKEVTIEVTNPESLIFGATVKVPADALPADVDLATVSIFYFPVMEPAPSALAAHGNGAKVTLTKLPSGEDVLPVAALTISLPVTKDSTKPIGDIVLGTVRTDDGTLVAVENGRSDAAKKHAVGDTKGFTTPFIAAWKIAYEGGAADENSLIVKVTAAGDECIAFGKLNPDLVVASITDSSGWYKWELGVNAGGAFLSQNTVKDTAIGSPDAGASLPSDGFTVQCGQNQYIATTFDKFTLGLSDWSETSQVPGSSGGTTHLGSVKLSGEFDYTTVEGARVQGAVNVTKTGFNWFTNP